MIILLLIYFNYIFSKKISLEMLGDFIIGINLAVRHLLSALQVSLTIATLRKPMRRHDVLMQQFFAFGFKLVPPIHHYL